MRLVEPENERRHISHLEALWRLTENELRPKKVKEALSALLKPRGPLSAATVNKVRGTGRKIIREALINERWTGPNPFDVVTRLKESKPDFRTLTIDEARAILPHLRPDRRRQAIAMLYLGLRPGELKALQWVDVDSKNKTVKIHRSNGRNATKTGKTRTVPIPQPLQSVFTEAIAGSPLSCPFVFPTFERVLGKYVITDRRQRDDAKLSRMLQVAMRKAGLVTGYELICKNNRKKCGLRTQVRTIEQSTPTRCSKCNFKLLVWGTPLQVRFYDLRHSAATLHREAGADPLAIQILLGHAPENLTDSVYTHLSIEYVRRELDKLKI